MNPTRQRPEVEEIRERCLGLLARREHTRRELLQKLRQRGFDEAEIANDVLDELEAQGLLSEARFVESFIRSRVESGQGPLKIRAALQERGIAANVAEVALDEDRSIWRERCRQTWRKRFGAAPGDRREAARQMRFLASRGFEVGDIRAVLQAVGTAEQNND